ncbi:unnamed protein product [Rhodiola kirilowii]
MAPRSRLLLNNSPELTRLQTKCFHSRRLTKSIINKILELNCDDAPGNLVASTLLTAACCFHH